MSECIYSKSYIKLIVQRSKKGSVSMDKGLFITFEGLDGSGKSTQIDLLYSSLVKKGLKVIKTVEPGGTELGKDIRDILLHKKQFDMEARTETLLFLASRAELVCKVIKPHLEKGSIVISDRFSDSTVVYQGFARGLGPEQIIGLNRWATGGLEPDITFIMDIGPDKCEQRDVRSKKKKDRIESEEMVFKEKIHAGYRKLSKMFKERVVLIDGNSKRQEIAKVILDKVLEALDESA